MALNGSLPDSSESTAGCANVDAIGATSIASSAHFVVVVGEKQIKN
jgi:hypothetical protein